MPKITKQAVDAIAPGAEDVWLWDTEVQGFGVRVQPTGRKTYVVRYRTKDAKRTPRKPQLAGSQHLEGVTLCTHPHSHVPAQSSLQSPQPWPAAPCCNPL